MGLQLAAGTDLDTADRDGNTSLYHAANTGHDEVGALAEGGADLDKARVDAADDCSAEQPQ